MDRRDLYVPRERKTEHPAAGILRVVVEEAAVLVALGLTLANLWVWVAIIATRVP